MVGSPVSRRPCLPAPARVGVAALALGAAALLSGCAHHLGRVPASSEFEKPVETIWAENPELAKCRTGFGRWFFCAIWEMPYAQDLVDAWGEPTDTTFSGWNLMPFGILPPFHPTVWWNWEKADKRISVLIDRPMAYGYEPHVWMVSIDPVETQAAPPSSE